MSEYQYYEFMAVDRPLTGQQLKEVNKLSSHIDASASHAVIEYHWGDFKHDPIVVMRKYFDAFLYWANWGSPQLAFRFPHGALPADLLNDFDCDAFVTFSKQQEYDILHFDFGQYEAEDEWHEYELGSFIAIRNELLEGDLRSLYIAWLASQDMMRDYEDEEEEYEAEEEDDEEEEGNEDDEANIGPIVPPGLNQLTAAQQELMVLLRVPSALVGAAALYSDDARLAPADDFMDWVQRLPRERCDNYLVRLANNEPGLSRLLVRELRDANQHVQSEQTSRETRVPFTELLTKVEAIEAKEELERQARERQGRMDRLQYVHFHQDELWKRVDEGAMRQTSTGYDQALSLLVELRDVADEYKEVQEFQTRFNTWIQSHLRRPALIERLKKNKFTIPKP
ncbi:hypothetical protein KDW_32560 [Dictyobacter vulcani]|uniref:Uncharacterized protein n=1 Tax=Dictyobacter vulcani TaxID=2607529 RepID=A0A5J4KI13_9CHLR|nr:hypothetical protein [Dictyobacter vulcani]GER89094.1 hypothetical protein KDW_32560 [Dictyobacter vulcani]